MGFWKEIKEEIQVVRDRDPAMHSDWEVFLYPSFHAMMAYKRAHKQYLKGHYFRARWISQRSAAKTRIEIHPGAQIGKGFFIDHGTGVVIGETAIVGDNVTLYQGVTLGGTGKEQGKRHPTIGNNVMIGSGAKVLGNITIGDNCKIAAGAVVLHDVPPNCTVVGVPGRVVKMLAPSGKEGRDLDQIHFTDPVQVDIECLNRGQSALVNQILNLKDAIRDSRADIKKALNERDAMERELAKARQELEEERRVLALQKQRADSLESMIHQLEQRENSAAYQQTGNVPPAGIKEVMKDSLSAQQAVQSEMSNVSLSDSGL